MGCDIRMSIEVKIDDTWHYYGEANIKRNYELFSRLAGVRGTLEPIAQPRGLPDDISPILVASAKRWEGDAHNTRHIRGGRV